jgi:cytochrome c-type biogenesis protein CcmH/NrfG
VLLTILLCLILTQSRTAYAGLFCATSFLGLLFALRRRTRSRDGPKSLRPWLIVFGVVLIVTVVVYAAWRRGKIDEKLVSQAGKSLGYRWQYWQATWDLICDFAWFGTGPGNFRSHYLRYKLPESSEEIVDPHNLVLELCATSGIPAGGAMLAMLAVSIGRIMLCRPGQPSQNHATTIRGEGSGEDLDQARTLSGALRDDRTALYTAGVCAWLFAYLFASSGPATYVALILAWICGVTVLRLALPRGLADPRTFACALVGMSLHLLGSGGISMPGVAQSLWLLAALGLNAAEGNSVRLSLHSRPLARGVLLATAAGALCFVGLVVRPVMVSLAAMADAKQWMKGREWAAVQASLQRAAQADPLAAEPWLELARIHYEYWDWAKGRERQEEFGRALRSLEEAIRRSPSRLEPYVLLARLFEARAAREPAFWEKAAEGYRRCTELYPSSAVWHAQLANALWHSGDPASAMAEMRRAQELDRATPHRDKKLSDRDREIIEARLREGGVEG